LLVCIAAYAENAVKQPFINVEEKIDRFVGRRTRTPDGLKAGMRMQASGLEFSQGFQASLAGEGRSSFQKPRRGGPMDDQNAGAKRDVKDLECRPPVEGDIAALLPRIEPAGREICGRRRICNYRGGFPRFTGDVDLIVAADAENEAKVFSALSTLPDNAVRELQPVSCNNTMSFAWATKFSWI